MKDTYRPVVSEAVAAEIADAREPVQYQHAEVLAPEAEVLAVDEAVLQLASAYQARDIVSPKHADDAVHIALAAGAEVDLLVRGNFRHIVRYEKIRLFNAMNLERGYKPLQIYSPREVAHDGED
ncbi:MAG: hypothetical protein H0X65_11470 [Gemmatimonadetes bacterium]|nr:hypothetical protein [Gemmatimonadota bacterium]